MLRKHLVNACKGSPGGASSKSGEKPLSDRDLDGIVPRKRKRSLKGVTRARTSASLVGSDTTGSPVQTPAPAAIRDDPPIDFTASPTLVIPNRPTINPTQLFPLNARDDDFFSSTSDPPANVPSRVPSAMGFRGAIGWSDGGGQTANDIDDLFSWLFNNAPFQEQQRITDAFLVGTPLSSTVLSASNPTLEELVMPTDMAPFPDVAPVPTLPAEPTAPAPIHPFAVPNQPLSGPPQTFSEDWAVRGWLPPQGTDVLNERAREEMLAIFDGELRETVAQTFTIETMSLYLELYFLHFAPLYPIIHRPSLPYRRLPPDLLLTIICVGTAFAADKVAFNVASRMHKRIRNRVFERVEEEPRTDIASIQTILLINHFSRSHCSLIQHDVAQIFHSPSIFMARLTGVFLPNYSSKRRSTGDPMENWLDWVAEEERVRLGWFAFMMDTENSSLFRHWLLTHCFSMQIPFPSTEAVWTAAQPFEWRTSLLAAGEAPTFRNALRDLAGRGVITPSLNIQSLWILLHGLISVSWTLLWRDLGDLSMVHESKITQWKESLRRAFGIWRQHMREIGEGGDSHIYWAGIPFAYLGEILLLSDTEQIRIFAGASNVAGRPISPGEWAAANSYVREWARSQDGAFACGAAFELLGEVFKWSGESRFQTAPTLVAWCAYIGALVVWAYSSMLEGQDSLRAPYIIASTASSPLDVIIEPSIARREAIIYIDRYKTISHPFAIGEIKGKNKCSGVIAYTAFLAGTLHRGIVDECRKVLIGLLTEHL